MGFTVFAIEANMPEAVDVNNYVLNGIGNSKDVLADYILDMEHSGSFRILESMVRI